MAEKIEQNLAAYKAKETNDETIVQTIIDLQRRLTPKQRLVLTVHTAPLDTPSSESEDDSIAIVKDEPREFANRLRKIMQSPRVKLVKIKKDGKLPSVMEIVIPDNRYQQKSAEELGQNTSESRATTLSGDVRQYLESSHYRGKFYYLTIRPNGAFFDPTLILHPSNIHKIQIKTVKNGSRLGEPVIFRAAQ